MTPRPSAKRLHQAARSARSPATKKVARFNRKIGEKLANQTPFRRWKNNGQAAKTISTQPTDQDLDSQLERAMDSAVPGSRYADYCERVLRWRAPSCGTVRSCCLRLADLHCRRRPTTIGRQMPARLVVPAPFRAPSSPSTIVTSRTILAEWITGVDRGLYPYKGSFYSTWNKCVWRSGHKDLMSQASLKTNSTGSAVPRQAI